jgi:hypothetical protein
LAAQIVLMGSQRERKDVGKTLFATRKLSLWMTWFGGALIVLSAFLVTLEIFYVNCLIFL